MTQRVKATRLVPEHRLAAAARLVGCPEGGGAARRFLEAAPGTGIDPSLMWTTIGPQGQIRQVCLAVLGAGRTAMLFVSAHDPGFGDALTQQAERGRCIKAAGSYLELQTNTSLIQSLPEQGETWATESYEAGGLRKLAELSYLRRPYTPNDQKTSPTDFAEGFEVVTVASVGGLASARNELIEALESSYEQTLDCPGLVGMRETEDVLESHLAVGLWDASHWWLIRRGGVPAGCLLLNQCPELDSVELVYVGLSVPARGSGLGHKLLCLGIAQTHGLGAREMTCAVDRANAPALKLYSALGFERFANRTAMVGTPSEVARDR